MMVEEFNKKLQIQYVVQEQYPIRSVMEQCIRKSILELLTRILYAKIKLCCHSCH
jgi:hypothetical protein